MESVNYIQQFLGIIKRQLFHPTAFSKNKNCKTAARAIASSEKQPLICDREKEDLAQVSWAFLASKYIQFSHHYNIGKSGFYKNSWPIV